MSHGTKYCYLSITYDTIVHVTVVTILERRLYTELDCLYNRLSVNVMLVSI